MPKKLKPTHKQNIPICHFKVILLDADLGKVINVIDCVKHV